MRLGKAPISNALIKDKNNKINKYPLNLFICKNCYLGQLEDFVPKKKIFNKRYRYFSSFSKHWVVHSKKLVSKVIKRFNVNKKKSLVAELASNDGYLLQHFVKKKIKCYGVEPSLSVAKVSKNKGIKTFVKFFNNKTANYLKKKGLSADVILALNVVGHVPDIVSFMKGAYLLLKNNGVIVVEIPYFLNLIKKKQFDTIYHEHYSYFSLVSMTHILNKCKLHVFDFDYIDTHGGSIRYYISKNNSKYKITPKISKIMKNEKNFFLNKYNYIKFMKEYNNIKISIKKFFFKMKKKEKIYSWVWSSS